MTGALALWGETAANIRKQRKFKIISCFLSVHRNLSAYQGRESLQEKTPWTFVVIVGFETFTRKFGGNNGTGKSLKGHSLIK